MSNPFYTVSGVPTTRANGASAPMRAEFVAIQAGFDLLAAGINGITIGLTTPAAGKFTDLQAANFTSNFVVNTNKFSVAYADGNTNIDGTLTVAKLITANLGVNAVGNNVYGTKWAIDGSTGDFGTTGGVSVNGTFSPNGALGGNLGSGQYDPNPVGVANVDAITSNSNVNYMRMGNVCRVSGSVQIDPTTASTQTTVDFGLPIASNLGAFTQLSGIAVRGTFVSSQPIVGYISGETTGDKARLNFFCDTDANNRIWSFEFSYRII